MSETSSFLKPYLRGWPIIVISMVVGYLGASKYLNYVTPMYESTAKLRLADHGEGVPHSNLYKDLDVFATNQKLDAEIQILTSHILLNKVLDSVNLEVQIFRVGNLKKQELFKDSPIDIIPVDFEENQKDRTYKLHLSKAYLATVYDGETLLDSGNFGDTLTVKNSKIIVKINKEIIAHKAGIKIPDDYEFVICSKQAMFSDLAKNLDVSPIDKDVAVIRISYKSPHPEKAALFPNVLAKIYIQDYIDTKFNAANITVKFLDDRINEVGTQLSNIENKILTYRNDYKITNISQETETDLRKLSQLKIQQTNLKMSLQAIIELESYIQSGKNDFYKLAPNFEAFTDLLSTEMVKKIKQLQSDKRDLLLQYTEKDERVLIIDKKVNDLTSYLIESIKNTKNNLKIKYDKLTADIVKGEEVFIGVPEKENALNVLNREFNIYQQSYNFLNGKKIEAEIARSAKIAFHRIITPAYITKTPVSPNRGIIKIVTSILFLMGAIAFIFIIHSLKAKVNDIATVEKNSMIPIVAEVPKLLNKKGEKSFFLILLAQFEVKKIIAPHEILCFTGYCIKEGASYICKNLVNSFVYQKRKVLLIDFHSILYNKEMLQVDKPTSINEYLDVFNIKNDMFKSFSNAQIQEWILQFRENYEQILVLNEEFGSQFTLSIMDVAHMNLVCIDTRLTPAKEIIKIDLMKEEYSIPSLYFAINRIGYNPSLIREIFMYFSGLFRKVKILVKRKMNA